MCFVRSVKKTYDHSGAHLPGMRSGHAKPSLTVSVAELMLLRSDISYIRVRNPQVAIPTACRPQVQFRKEPESERGSRGSTSKFAPTVLFVSVPIPPGTLHRLLPR